MHGVFYISASIAISSGYSGKQLSERHHWLFSAKFIGAILSYLVQGTLEMFLGIKYVILLGIFLFIIPVIIVILFVPNTNTYTGEKAYDDDKKEDIAEIEEAIKPTPDGDTEKKCNKDVDEKSHLLMTEHSSIDTFNRIKQIISQNLSTLSKTFTAPDAASIPRNIYAISIATILLVELFDGVIKQSRKDTIFLYLEMSSWEEANISFLFEAECICSLLILTFGVPFLTRVLQVGDHTTCALVLSLRTVNLIWFSLIGSLYLHSVILVTNMPLVIWTPSSSK